MIAAQNLRTTRTGRDDLSCEGAHGNLLTVFRFRPAESLKPGQSLFFEGDPAKHVFAVLEGNLRICRMLPDGRRVIAGFIQAGDIIGVSFKSHHLYSVEAINDVRFRRITRKAFDEELEVTPSLRPAVLTSLCDEIAAAQDQMVLLSCKNAEERLCSFLVKQLQLEHACGQPQGVIRLPMTRLDIADYLGMTIETVSRTMTKLIGKGIVEPMGRRGIKVLSRASLAHLAGDEDEYHADNIVAFNAAIRH